MADKKNDMFAIMLNQPDATYEDMILHGVTANNTGLKDLDYYKQLDVVKNNPNFKTNGTFDETKLQNFYNSVSASYNNFSNDDYEKHVIESLDKDPLDWTQPFKTNVKDVTAVIYRGSGDFGRRSKGITGIGSIGAPVFSMREIAQDSEAKDENGNGLGWTPNNHGFFNSIFAPTMVLATYDEDGTHEENGRTVAHKKGEFKLNENGDPFYEKLGDRDPYGKEVLRVSDTLTVDGTPINKWDFLDSDGLDKSIGKTILQTTAYIAPLLIPGMSSIWGTIGMVGGLTAAMPTLLKGINGILGSNDSAYGKALTSAEGWLERWSPTKSDKGKEKFLSWENIGEILSSSSIQLFSQRQVANLSRTLLRGGDTMVNTAWGQRLSLGYMALTSSTDSYSAFKEAGASDAVAGIGMLATMAGLYGLMSTDYFKDALFKGSWLDESELNNIIKNYSKDNIERLAQAETGKGINELIKGSKKEAAGLFNRVKQAVTDGWKAFSKSSLSGTPKDLTVAKGVVEGGKKTGARKALSAFNVILNRSVNEGFEETVEEVAQDLIKSVFAGGEALGINMTSNPDEKLDFGWSLGEAMQRYLTSFGGGFLGGAVFEGITQYENAIYNRPTISDLDNTSEQMLYLVLSGKGEEVKERARMYRDKGILGNKNLSIKKFTKDEDGNIRFAAASNDDNQNEFAYQLITHEVDRLESILKDAGITAGAVNRYLTEFGGNVDKIGKLDTIQSAAIKQLAMHTTFMDDLVKLSKDLVTVQSQIDALSTSTTDAEARRNEQSSQELQNYQKIKNELLAQKEAFFNHENDREYIEQAMYLSNSRLQKQMLNIAENGGTFDENQYALTGDSGFANYIWLRYHKKLSDLSEQEKTFYKTDYDSFINDPDNISDIQNVGKTLFQLYKSINETFAPKLINAEDNLKDVVANPLYLHKSLSQSETYRRYINDKAAFDKVKSDIAIAEGKVASLQPETEEYSQALVDLQAKVTIAEDLEQRIAEYESVYDPVKDIFTEIPEQQGIAIRDGIQNAALTIKDLNDIVKSNITDTNAKAEARLGIKENFKRLTNLAMQYFTTLRDNNAIAGNAGDLLLQNVMQYAAETIENVSQDDILRDPVSLFNLPDDYVYDIKSRELLAKIEMIKETLKGGDLESVILMINSLKDIIDIEGVTDDQRNEILNSAIDNFQKYLFGENLIEWFNNVDQIMRSVKTYGIIDLLNDMQIGVGDDVIPLLNLIEESKNSLLSSNDLAEFALQPNAKAALLKVQSMLSFATVAIQSAYDGTNEAINSLPKNDNDVQLAEITENTKNRLVEDLLYLTDIVDTMLSIADKNENTKKNYPQKAERFFHQNLMNEFLNGEKENEATWVGKFYKKFNVDIKDLWERASSQSGVSIDVTQLTTENFAEFKKRYIKFWQLLKSEISSYEENGNTVSRTDAEIGDLLGEMLDDKARLGQSGEVKTEDESNNALTNLGIVVIIGTLLNEDYGNFYSAYIKEQEAEDYPYMPFMQQELAVHVSYEFAISDKDSILSHIADAIDASKVTLPENIDDKEQLEKSWNSLQLLKNLFFIQGGTGAGKTSATSLLTYRMLQKAKGEDFSAMVIAPTEKQLIPYADILKIDDDKQKSIYSDLIKQIIEVIDENGEYSKIDFYNLDLSDVENNETLKEIFENVDTRLKPGFLEEVRQKIVDNYKGFKPKYIFADEAQFLNVGCLQLLNAFADAIGAKVLLYGDKKQNGAFYKKGTHYAESSIADALVLSCPSLGESLRFENIAKEKNYKSIKNCLEAIESEINKNYLRDYTKISDVAKKEIDSRVTQNLGVIFSHYTSNNVFVGEKSIAKEEVEQNVEKLKNISKSLHEDGISQICIITDDKTQYSEYLDMQGIEVLTPREVQGREYDYVVIDKKFDSSNLYTAYKDVYTLMGRSKIGTMFVGDLNDLRITFSDNGEKFLTNPINNEQSFKSFAEWKEQVFSAVKSMLGTPSENSTSPKVSSDDTGENGQNFSFEDSTDEPEAAIPGSSSVDTPNNDNGIDESGKDSVEDSEKEISIQRKRISDKLLSDNGAYYDWNDYVTWALDENGLLLSEGVKLGEKKSSNKYSIISDFTEGFSNRNDIVTLFRKFASAVVYNMELKEHHVNTLSNLIKRTDRAIITELVANWNSEIRNGAHTFVSYGNPETSQSVVYWRTKISGKTKLIPVALINGVIDGQVSLSGKNNLFEKAEEFWAIKGDPSSTNINLTNRESSVGNISQVKIFSPPKENTFADDVPPELNTTSGTTKFWFNNNSGHAQVLVTDCEILEDADFEQVFNIKRKNKEVLSGFDIDSRLEHDVNGKKLGSSQRNSVMTANINGANIPMIAINPHRYVDLPTLYNIANIARFAAGQIPWSDESGLSETQRQLVGENSKQAAMNFVAKYIGEFDLESTATNQIAKNRKNVAVNKRRLHYDYRLLTLKGAYNLLNTAAAAIYNLSKEENANWFNYFTEHLLKSTFKSHKAERSGITYDNGLHFNVATKQNDKTVFKHYFVEFDKNGTLYDIRISQLKLQDDGSFSDFKDAKVKVIPQQNVEDINLFSILSEIDNSLTEDEIIDAFGSGRIQMQFLQRCSRDKDIFYNTNDDYNIVAGLFNAIPNAEGILEKLETKLKKYDLFRDGFALNDNRKINTDSERARKSTGWADSKTYRSSLLKSNLKRIDGSIWSLDPARFSERSADLPNNIGFVGNSETNNAFKFESDSSKWDNGTIWQPNAEVDDRWLQMFTEEGTFKRSNGRPVSSARIRSIDFTTGKIIFGVGSQTLTGTLKKNDINEFPSVEELSGGTVNSPGFNVNGISFKINDGKIMSGSSELKPIFKDGDLIRCSSEDGKSVLVSQTLLSDNGVSPDVPKVITAGNDIFLDKATGEFYTLYKKLGKPLDYSENNVIFVNGIGVDYNAIDEKYLPKDIIEKRNLSGDKSESKPKPNKFFREDAKYEVNKTGFAETINGTTYFYGKSWIVNGKWLYDNSNYDGGDGTFVITTISNKAITTSDGQTLVLNNNANVPMQLIVENGSKLYLKSLLKKQGLLNKDLESLIDVNSESINTTIDLINNHLINNNIWFQVNALSPFEFKVESVNQAEHLINKFTQLNNIELNGDLSVDGDITYANGIQTTNGEKTDVGVYCFNDKVTVGLPYNFVKRAIFEWGESLGAVANNPLINSLFIKLLNNPLDENALEDLLKFLDSDESMDIISDDSFDRFQEVANLTKVLQKTIDDLKHNKINCEWHV